MLQGSIIFVLVVLGLGAIATAGYFLLRRGWFINWLKASFAMSLLMLAAGACLSLLDVLSYQQLMEEVPIATISVFSRADQQYDLTIATVDGVEQRFEIYGDQWQLDARLLTWIGPLAALGNKPLYRLDRISGRYVSLEQARNARQSIFELERSGYVDIWQLVKNIPFWIDANYGSAVYMPMENGAVFAVHLTAKGMNVRPVNRIAERLLNQQW
jgi:lysylphosphatidylglycerol synthetase-like protein (DUF2156 family)